MSGNKKATGKIDAVKIALVLVRVIVSIGVDPIRKSNRTARRAFIVMGTERNDGISGRWIAAESSSRRKSGCSLPRRRGLDDTYTTTAEPGYSSRYTHRQ